MPEWAASIVLLLAAYLVLVLLTLALIVSVAQLAELLPQYEDQMHERWWRMQGTRCGASACKQEQINAVVNAIDPGQLVALAGVGAVRARSVCSAISSSC